MTLNINVNKTDDITDEYGGGNAYLYDTLQDAVNVAAKRTDTESVTIYLLKQPESTEVKLPSETPDNITLSKLGTEDINFSEVNITDAGGSKVTVGNDGIYEDAIETWGREAQMLKAAEELCELAAAINRLLCCEKSGYRSHEEVLAELMGEWADVEIMLNQLHVMIEMDDETYIGKLQALEEKIRKAREKLG